MTSQQGFSVCVLGSSSSGNCTLVRNGRSMVLIDCGFGPRFMISQLRRLGVELSQLSGVLLTHTHGDHVRENAVRTLTAAGIPFFVPPSIANPLQREYRSLREASERGLLREISGSELSLKTLSVTMFPVPHDSPGGCFGYSLCCQEDGIAQKITVATDIGFVSEGAITGFANSDIMVIESNHDYEMLERSGRPLWLKRRIRERGHLSNDESAELTLRILDASHVAPKTIVLAHISQVCNTNELALLCTGERLERSGLASIQLVETWKASPQLVHLRRASEQLQLPFVTGISP